MVAQCVSCVSWFVQAQKWSTSMIVAGRVTVLGVRSDRAPVVCENVTRPLGWSVCVCVSCVNRGHAKEGKHSS